MATCDCEKQLKKSAKLVFNFKMSEVNHIDNPTLIQLVNDQITEYAGQHDWLIERPGKCYESLDFVATRKLPRKLKPLISSHQSKLIERLYFLDAPPDVLEHVSGYSEDSTEFTMLSQLIAYTHNLSGLHLQVVSSLMSFIDLSRDGNKLAFTIMDPDWRNHDDQTLLSWLNLIRSGSKEKSVTERCKKFVLSLRNLAMEQGKSDIFYSLIEENCWNLFGAQPNEVISFSWF